jgi:hypothetical protein
MRPKFVFGMLLMVLLVLVTAVYLKQHLGNVSATAPATPEIAAPAPVAASNVEASVAPPPAPSSAAPVVTNILTDEQRQAAIDTETDRLQQWSMNDDPASLSNILADLTNSEKEIRDAAIEAAKQFGSTNAIPTLKAVAANTTDTEEQIDLLEAANFLSLPSISFDGPPTPKTPEQIQADEQRRAERRARRQAQMQRQAPNQNLQSAPDQSTTPPSGPN